MLAFVLSEAAESQVGGNSFRSFWKKNELHQLPIVHLSAHVAHKRSLQVPDAH